MKSGVSLRRIPLAAICARPGRSAFLGVLALLQAASALVALLLVQGLGHELARAEQRLGADILVYPSAGFLQLDSSCVNMLGTPVQYHRDRSSLKLLAQNEDVAALSYQLHVALPASEGDGARWIIGYDPDTDFVVTPWIDDSTATSTDLGRGVLLGSGVATDSLDTQDAHTQDADRSVNSIEIVGEILPVAGRLSRTGGDYDTSVFVPFHMLGPLLTHGADHGLTGVDALDPMRDYSLATIDVTDASAIESVTNWINLYIRKVKALHSDTRLSDTAHALGTQSAGITILAGAAWLILLAALGVAQSVMMNERRAELHIWRIVGASNTRIRRLMIAEYLTLQVVGSGTGLVLAWLLLAHIPSTLRAQALAPSEMMLPLGVAFGASLLVAWVGARVAVTRALRGAQTQMLLTA